MARKLRYEDAVPDRLRRVADAHHLSPPRWYVPSGGDWLAALDDADAADEGPDSGDEQPDEDSSVTEAKSEAPGQP